MNYLIQMLDISNESESGNGPFKITYIPALFQSLDRLTFLQPTPISFHIQSAQFRWHQ